MTDKCREAFEEWEARGILPKPPSVRKGFKAGYYAAYNQLSEENKRLSKALIELEGGLTILYAYPRQKNSLDNDEVWRLRRIAKQALEATNKENDGD
jgi:hypothetical protein